MARCRGGVGVEMGPAPRAVVIGGRCKKGRRLVEIVRGRKRALGLFTAALAPRTPWRRRWLRRSRRRASRAAAALLAAHRAHDTQYNHAHEEYSGGDWSGAVARGVERRVEQRPGRPGFVQAKAGVAALRRGQRLRFSALLPAQSARVPAARRHHAGDPTPLTVRRRRHCAPTAKVPARGSTYGDVAVVVGAAAEDVEEEHGRLTRLLLQLGAGDCMRRATRQGRSRWAATRPCTGRTPQRDRRRPVWRLLVVSKTGPEMTTTRSRASPKSRMPAPAALTAGCSGSYQGIRAIATGLSAPAVSPSQSGRARCHEEWRECHCATPQAALAEAALRSAGDVHAPGHMLVTGMRRGALEVPA